MKKLKEYKIFGRNFYPSLMLYQLGLHLAAVPMFIIALIYIIKGIDCTYALMLGISCLVLEIGSFLTAFDEKEAKYIEENGWPKCDF